MMITDFLCAFVKNALDSMLGWLPVGTFPTVSGSFTGWPAAIDYYVPFLAPLRFWIAVVITTFPAMLVYRSALWVFNRLRGS
jgi:hypothetical protein